MKRKSATFDEYKHLRNGYIYLRPGVYTKMPEPDELINPPLVNAITALPLIELELTGREAEAETDDGTAPLTKAGAWKQTFPFDTGRQPDSLLARGRAATLLLSLLTGLLLFTWGRQLYGEGGALCALALYALSPNILAHARLVTVDLGFAAFSLLAAHACWRCAVAPGRPRAAWMGVAIGLALLAKHSALVLLPPLILAFVIRRFLPGEQRLPGEPDRRPGRTIEHLALAAVCALAVVWTGCRVFLLPAFHAAAQTAASGDIWAFFAEPLRLWLHGVFIVKDARMNAFLFGRLSLTGWWYYFPAAILIKSTIGMLLLSGWALAGALSTASSFRRKAVVAADELFLWLPALFFLVVSMAKGINVGLRHVLVMYPLLFLLCGRLWPTAAPVSSDAATAARRAGGSRAAVLTFLALHAAAALLVHPHYLAHFNQLIGGPNNGYRAMVDCNLDWGQDLKLLAEFLDATADQQVRLAYFGPTPPEIYGIRYQPVSPKNERHAEPGFYAVSATRLQNLYGFQRAPERFRWLRSRTPDHQVGHSILIYRITPDEARELARGQS
jgi:hypothetical protein